MKQKNIYSKMKAGVILSVFILLASSFTVAALNTEKQNIFLIGERIDTPSQSMSRDEYWIHYDGDNFNGIGLDGGGTFEGAIRLTSDELGSYASWSISTVKVYSRSDLGVNSSFLKIYEQGTATTPGDVIVLKEFTFPTEEQWFEIDLDEPIVIDGSDDIWVGIEVTHVNGDYPLGIDGGPAVVGKSDWIYADVLGGWVEMIDFDLNYNWNIRVQVEEFNAPETTVELDGTMEGDVYVSNVTVTLSATDDLSGVNYTMYKLNEDDWTMYTDTFTVTEDGEYTLLFYSVDYCGNVEEEQTEVFTIQREQPGELVIEIIGGLGVSAILMNLGETEITDIDWTIEISGALLFAGQSKSGNIASIGPDSDEMIGSMPIGIGPIDVTVTAGDVTETASGFLLLFFVLGM
jgi:hypothetical protein